MNFFIRYQQHQRLLRACVVVATSGRIATRRNLFPTTTSATASRSFRDTANCHSGDEEPTTASWSELIASRSGKKGDKTDDGTNKVFERPSWSEEWKRLGLGAELVEGSNSGSFPENLFFVQLGFGVDQHGDRHKDNFATKAAIRAVRNSIEFNSIPGVIDHVPGGRKGMLIHVKLGVPPPPLSTKTGTPVVPVDALEVAKVFPYGKLLPIKIVTGGLEFHSGRVVEELGDDDDVGICCVACVSIGYNSSDKDSETGHKTYNTKDGH
mmetsp:Transcript_9991/g.23463  ORF Transcript_9991/g.23463 Transcript_9991/m.23463 type:complete len:267 (+) Transcript_9991:91-891(+)